MSKLTLQEISSRSISNLTFDQLMIKCDLLSKQKYELEENIEKEKHQLRELIWEFRQEDEEEETNKDDTTDDVQTKQLQQIQTEIDKMENELLQIDEELEECRSLIQEVIHDDFDGEC